MKKVLICILTLTVLFACSNAVEGNSIVVSAVQDGFLFDSQEFYAVKETGEKISMPVPFSWSVNAQWSPDRQWVAYETDDINPQVVISKWDGSVRISLTNDTYTRGGEPAWSPDGNQIAAYFQDTDNQYGLYIVDVSCIFTNQECVPEYRFITQGGGFPTWSPDGKQLAFWSDNQIFVISIATLEEAKRITPEELVCLDPDWSPFGDEIAVRCFVPFQGKNIFVVNADGSNFRNISNSKSEDLMPIWSPDGTKIAFVSDRAEDLGKSIPSVGEGAYSNAVYIMNSDGTNVRRVSPYNNESIDWIDWLSP